MPMFVWCELVCRGCAATSEGEFTTGSIPRRDLWKAAKTVGWVKSRNYADEIYCSEACRLAEEEQLND